MRKFYINFFLIIIALILQNNCVIAMSAEQELAAQQQEEQTIIATLRTAKKKQAIALTQQLETIQQRIKELERKIAEKKAEQKVIGSGSGQISAQYFKQAMAEKDRLIEAASKGKLAGNVVAGGSLLQQLATFATNAKGAAIQLDQTQRNTSNPPKLDEGQLQDIIMQLHAAMQQLAQYVTTPMPTVVQVVQAQPVQPVVAPVHPPPPVNANQTGGIGAPPPPPPVLPPPPPTGFPLLPGQQQVAAPPPPPPVMDNPYLDIIAKVKAVKDKVRALHDPEASAEEATRYERALKSETAKLQKDIAGYGISKQLFEEVKKLATMKGAKPRLLKAKLLQALRASGVDPLPLFRKATKQAGQQLGGGQANDQQRGALLGAIQQGKTLKKVKNPPLQEMAAICALWNEAIMNSSTVNPVMKYSSNSNAFDGSIFSSDDANSPAYKKFKQAVKIEGSSRKVLRQLEHAELEKYFTLPDEASPEFRYCQAVCREFVINQIVLVRPTQEHLFAAQQLSDHTLLQEIMAFPTDTNDVARYLSDLRIHPDFHKPRYVGVARLSTKPCLLQLVRNYQAAPEYKGKVEEALKECLFTTVDAGMQPIDLSAQVTKLVALAAKQQNEIPYDLDFAAELNKIITSVKSVKELTAKLERLQKSKYRNEAAYSAQLRQAIAITTNPSPVLTNIKPLAALETKTEAKLQALQDSFDKSAAQRAAAQARMAKILPVFAQAASSAQGAPGLAIQLALNYDDDFTPNITQTLCRHTSDFHTMISALAALEVKADVPFKNHIIKCMPPCGVLMENFDTKFLMTTLDDTDPTSLQNKSRSFFQHLEETVQSFIKLDREQDSKTRRAYLGMYPVTTQEQNKLLHHHFVEPCITHMRPLVACANLTWLIERRHPVLMLAPEDLHYVLAPNYAFDSPVRSWATYRIDPSSLPQQEDKLKDASVKAYFGATDYLGQQTGNVTDAEFDTYVAGITSRTTIPSAFIADYQKFMSNHKQYLLALRSIASRDATRSVMRQVVQSKIRLTQLMQCMAYLSNLNVYHNINILAKSLQAGNVEEFINATITQQKYSSEKTIKLINMLKGSMDLRRTGQVLSGIIAAISPQPGQNGHHPLVSLPLPPPEQEAEQWQEDSVDLDVFQGAMQPDYVIFMHQLKMLSAVNQLGTQDFMGSYLGYTQGEKAADKVAEINTELARLQDEFNKDQTPGKEDFRDDLFKPDEGLLDITLKGIANSLEALTQEQTFSIGGMDKTLEAQPPTLEYLRHIRTLPQGYSAKETVRMFS